MRSSALLPSGAWRRSPRLAPAKYHAGLGPADRTARALPYSAALQPSLAPDTGDRLNGGLQEDESEAERSGTFSSHLTPSPTLLLSISPRCRPSKSRTSPRPRRASPWPRPSSPSRTASVPVQPSHSHHQPQLTLLSMLWPFAQTEVEELVIKTVRVLACELTQQVRAHWALPPTGRAQPTPPR
jgi:hypothetical protein